MLKTLLIAAALTLPALAQTTEATPPITGSVYQAWNYLVVNQTQNVADVSIYHRFGPAFHLTRVGGGWVVPGGRLVVKLPKGETTYELEATFKKAGQDSPTIGKASVKWWLKDGSRDRLVNEGGNFYWKPF
jgi:hypothetical protein